MKSTKGELYVQLGMQQVVNYCVCFTKINLQKVEV